ncbi:replication-associated protein [robinz virus RP_326]|nr:replication-associated protein [robinz virus RP_326]
MGTRWQFRYALLTYAQCGNLDPFNVVNHISSLGGECIIGREHHEDGGLHLHAFCDFGRKLRSRNVRLFDVDGCHPNVEPTKQTPAAGWDYATKDGDVVAGGLERPGNGTSDKTDWAKIVAASNADEFWELCESVAPRALLCNFQSLRGFADWRFKPEPPKYEQPRGVQIDTGKFPELDAWVQQNIVRPLAGRNKSLLLWGPSRMGKTVWARSLGRHAYFGGLFSLDESTDVEYAVFDDMQGGLDYFHGYKFWLGHQKWFYATDKYKGKRLIHWGKPAIWIANTNPLMDKCDSDWLLANCDVIEINEKIVFYFSCQ